MRKKTENEKDKLLNLSLLDELNYNRFVDMYGVDLLIKTINGLCDEDTSLLCRLGMYDEEITTDDMDAYQYYINDIRNINDKDNLEYDNLLNEILLILKELNNLFDRVDNVSKIGNNKVVPWVNDKLNYCISNCSDKELLDNIKKLYNKYTVKRNLFIELNLKFVIMIAKSFWDSECFLELEDLIQYGNIGLIRAIEVYDLDKNVEFLTYAGYWIKHSIIYNSKKVMHPVRLPVNWYSIRNRWVRAIECLVQRLGRYPSFLEIAEYVQIEPKKLKMIVDSFSMCTSLELYMEDSLNEITEGFVDPHLCDKLSFLIDDEFSIDKDIENEQMSLELEHYMDLCLNDREKYILKSKYGFIDEKGVSELANMYGVSESRLYQIIQRSYIKLLRNNEFKKMKVYLR